MTPVRAMCAVLLVFAACAHSAATVEAKAGPAAADYYPLEVGTAWTYEVNLLGEKRTIDVTTLRQEGGFVLDSTGAQLASDGFGVRDQKRYLLRNPLEVGNKWSNVVSVASVEHYEIIGVGQRCEAPAGAWDDCVIVESRNRVEDGKTLVNEMTLAPHVGIVRLTTTLENQGKNLPQSSLALVKFAPVKPISPKNSSGLKAQ